MRNLKPSRRRAPAQPRFFPLCAELNCPQNPPLGFIGPIGDDLPSLIPLLFGLMIFFSTFAMTLDSFDAKSAAFQDDLDALKIGVTLRESSYIYSYAQFKSLCEKLQTQRLNYKAGIANLAPGQNETIFNIEFLQDSPELNANTYICPGGQALEEKGSASKKIVAKVFPIALQTTNSVGTNVVKPERLVVIVWK